MPKIVVNGYVADTTGDNEAAHEEANKTKLEAWFTNSANWAGLEDQLTKKLGADKFKNVVLTTPTVSYEKVTVGKYTWKNPKVTFNIQAKPGYQLTEPTTNPKQISLTIRVLYSSQESNQNLLTIKGAYPTAAPRNATVNDANVKSKVNVYVNYTGPAIELNSDIPTVGAAQNTTINGTSKVEDSTLNNAVKALLSGNTTTDNVSRPLMDAITKYIQTFDPKFKTNVTPSTYTNTFRAWTSWMETRQREMQGNVALVPALVQVELKMPDNLFLQQMKNDTEAVYFAVTAIASNGWLNTFLIRIPLTKFVKPLTVFTATPASASTQDSSASNTSPQTQLKVLNNKTKNMPQNVSAILRRVYA
ncbi:hemagglutinin [Mycoplasmopsis synoviae]|uniref:hemagglutinin n=1 Tax=Mycoplasmopsis synoviae TaxID=2109 RepID=UPI0034DB79DC